MLVCCLGSIMQHDPNATPTNSPRNIQDGSPSALIMTPCTPNVTEGILPPHLVQLTESCSAATSYRDVCGVTCAPGYEEASSNFTCGLDGAWGGSLECVPLKCSASALVAKKPFAAGNCTEDLDFGTSCTLGCDTGYSPVGSVSVSCTADQSFARPRTPCPVLPIWLLH